MSTSRLRGEKSDVRLGGNGLAGEVNKYFHQNPAADERKMRRIIAEDPEWNLMTVPLLSELCTKVIVNNYHTHPRHDELPLKHRKKVLNQIPTSLPLKITADLIDSEEYNFFYNLNFCDR